MKADTEERVRLSEITGIELTQEALDAIIESAKAEATFIENQIRLQIEGNEAMNNTNKIFISGNTVDIYNELYLLEGKIFHTELMITDI